MTTETINSLEELLHALPTCSGKDYVDIVHDMSLDVNEFEQYALWNSEFYTRNCIACNKDYELILLCWEADQETPIHCHGGQECWVYMLQGNLEESRYDLDNNTQSLTKLNELKLPEGKFSYMNDDMGLHSLKNASGNRAMSLHLYMNPIDECRIYDAKTDTISYRKMHYYSMEGQIL